MIRSNAVAAIEITSRDPAVRANPASRALARAAAAALAAPSVLDTQPWRWRVDDGTAELWADRRRQLPADPDGRLVALSCGAALHHARVALAVDGFGHAVSRTPEPDRPDLLAALRADRHAVRQPPAPDVLRMFRAMSTRRTDRRPYADLPVPEASLDRPSLDRLCAAAEANGARLHFDSTDGGDLHHAILSATGDTTSDWLTAGEAYSAVLLTATAEGFALHLEEPVPDRHPVIAVRLSRASSVNGASLYYAKR
jgi:hypothetical protein